MLLPDLIRFQYAPQDSDPPEVTGNCDLWDRAEKGIVEAASGVEKSDLLRDYCFQLI